MRPAHFSFVAYHTSFADGFPAVQQLYKITIQMGRCHRLHRRSLPEMIFSSPHFGYGSSWLIFQRLDLHFFAFLGDIAPKHSLLPTILTASFRIFKTISLKRSSRSPYVRSSFRFQKDVITRSDRKRYFCLVSLTGFAFVVPLWSPVDPLCFRSAKISNSASNNFTMFCYFPFHV